MKDNIYRLGTPVSDKETLEAIDYLRDNLPYMETLSACWRRLAREEAARLKKEVRQREKRLRDGQ